VLQGLLTSFKLPLTSASYRTGVSHLHAMSRELKDPMVWVDLEMTGLDVFHDDTILEMACVVTDGELNTVIEGPDLCIYHTEEQLAKMDGWCQKHHRESGLVDRVQKSSYSVQKVQSIMLDFIKEHVPTARTAPLAGNSVYNDKMFLMKFMPKFTNHLHYRLVDVSSVKELCRRWYPTSYASAPAKQGTHRALTDIRESIEELKYYRSSIFK